MHHSGIATTQARMHTTAFLPFYFSHMGFPVALFQYGVFLPLIIDIQSTVLCASAHFSAQLSPLDYAQHLR
jgi:hypothetical protein